MASTKPQRPAQPAPRVTKLDAPKGMSVKEVAGRMGAQQKLDKGDELSPDEQALLGEEPEAQAAEQVIDDAMREHEPAASMPEWATVPEGLVMPKGKEIYFIRIPAEWTDRPNDGDRQCIAWNLTVADEEIALKRTRGEQSRVLRECTMMMVRAIDGNKVDWTNASPGNPGNVRKWFDAIGPRGRILLQNVYARTHSIDDEVATRFFADCFASMSSV